MASATEAMHAAEFLVSEASGNRSRETITVLSGQDLVAGQVLGKVTVGAGSSAAFSTNTGNGAMGAITVGAGAKPGAYKLVIIEPGTNLGTFTVEDPEGIFVGRGVVASAFSAGGLAFTLADGATDFVAGDGFTITVAAGSGKYVKVDPEGTDGRHKAAGILYAAVDASAADATGVAFVRDCEVNTDYLDYDDLDAGEIVTAKAELKALGIIVREGI